MAQEGIATLPQSQPTTNPAVDLDATKNALLGEVGPEAMSAYEQGMDQASQQLNLPPDQLQVLLKILEAILQDPQNYAQMRQQLLQSGVRPEDLPEEFDGGYFTTMLVMVKEALKRSQGQSPTAQGPMPEQLPQGFKRGGLADVAASLASKGRNGDTILAHINPQEAMMLKRMGGSGTINPLTGLPEFFNLGKELSNLGGSVSNVFNGAANTVKSFVASPVGKIVTTVALTYLTAGMGVPLVAAAGLSAGAVSLAGGSDLKSALMSGLMAAGTAYVAPMVSSYMPGGAGSFLNAAATGGVMGAGYGLATGQNLQNSLKMGLTGAAVAGAANYLQAGPYAPKEGANGAPVTDMSQDVVLQPDGSYAPANSVEMAGPNMPSTSDYANSALRQSGALTPNQVSATNPGAPGSASMQDWMNQGNTTFDRSFDLTSNQNIDVGSGTGMGYNTHINSTPSNPVANTPNAPTQSGWMDYVPDFMKASDGSLSTPMVTGAVLGIGALTGGFNTSSPDTGANTPYTGIERDASGQPVTGSDLLNQNPDKYVYRPNITTAPSVPNPSNPSNPMDPYNGNTTNPNDINMINTRQFGQARQNPYGTFTPPPMGGGQTMPGTGTTLPQPYNTASMYDFLRSQGGYAQGGISQAFPRRTGGISGPGTGTSDDIPAMLSDGEFVITAKAVRGAGGGSRREGAKKLYRMMHALEKKAK